MYPRPEALESTPKRTQITRNTLSRGNTHGTTSILMLSKKTSNSTTNVVVVVSDADHSDQECLWQHASWVINWHSPLVPSHLGVKLSATPAPPALDNSQL